MKGDVRDELFFPDRSLVARTLLGFHNCVLTNRYYNYQSKTCTLNECMKRTV